MKHIGPEDRSLAAASLAVGGGVTGGVADRRRRRRRRDAEADHRLGARPGRGRRARAHGRGTRHRDRGRRRGELLRGRGHARQRQAGRRPARPELRGRRLRGRRAARARTTTEPHARRRLARLRRWRLHERPPPSSFSSGSHRFISFSSAARLASEPTQGGCDANLDPHAGAVPLLALTACGGDGGQSTAAAPGADLPQGSEPVELDPAEFTTEIDNRYWPMEPGTRWTYREIDEEGTVVTGRRHGHERDEGDRERRHGSDRPRHGHRGRPADRGHVRLVRPGRRGQRLVPRRGHRRVRGRRADDAGRLLRGGRRRRAARDHHARPIPSTACSTGRSTTRARPRTTARS